MVGGTSLKATTGGPIRASQLEDASTLLEIGA
jgi:hypothetical protein